MRLLDLPPPLLSAALLCLAMREGQYALCALRASSRRGRQLCAEEHCFALVAAWRCAYVTALRRLADVSLEAYLGGGGGGGGCAVRWGRFVSLELARRHSACAAAAELAVPWDRGSRSSCRVRVDALLGVELRCFTDAADARACIRTAAGRRGGGGSAEAALLSSGLLCLALARSATCGGSDPGTASEAASEAAAGAVRGEGGGVEASRARRARLATAEALSPVGDTAVLTCHEWGRLVQVGASFRTRDQPVRLRVGLLRYVQSCAVAANSGARGLAALGQMEAAGGRASSVSASEASEVEAGRSFVEGLEVGSRKARPSSVRAPTLHIERIVLQSMARFNK
jgi:hypothetical protein